MNDLSHLYDTEGKKRDWYCEDVLSGNLPVRKVFEDQRVVAFHHPYPETEIHVVVIPKVHVASLLADGARDGELLSSMVRAIQHSAVHLGLDTAGFFVRANAAAPGVTPHMHWHVMGPGVDPPRIQR
ncbi:MAG: HIT domain-containing protein [Candidatus Limnocylindria bacterium]